MNQLMRFTISEKEIAERLEETEEAISILSDKYMLLTVKNPKDKEGYEAVKKARIDIKARRVKVEKNGKAQRDDANLYNKAVLKVEHYIVDLLTPIENYLISQEKIVTDEQARIKAEAEAKEKAEAEAIRLAEEQRLAMVREEQEKKQKELDAQAEEQRKAAAEIKAAQDAIAHHQAIENAKIEAAAKAKIETEQRIKREADEKAAAEIKAQKAAEKKAAAAPDKEKLLRIANNYQAFDPVELKTLEAKEILEQFRSSIEKAVLELRTKSEVL